VTPFGSVDELFVALGRGASLSDEEELDLLGHSLQCASLLAERCPDDVELQVAGLVHDVGTVLQPNAPATHSRTGAAAVTALLGPHVAALVEGHDLAKRYLVVADASYRARLSERSIETLAAQGGPVSEAERRVFEAEPHFDALVTLRWADDDAKVPGRQVPALDAWRPVVDQVVQEVAAR
jgi:predicted HD phosphohydrolase